MSRELVIPIRGALGEMPPCPECMGYMALNDKKGKNIVHPTVAQVGEPLPTLGDHEAPYQ